MSSDDLSINGVLSQITSALVGQFELERLLDQVVNTSMKTLNAGVCSIFLEDREKEPGVITMMAGSGFAKPLVGKAKYKIGEGFTGYVAKHGQPFNLKTRAELESLRIEGHRIWLGKHDPTQWPSGQSEFRNLIALPLRIKEQILGVIKVENKEARLGSCFSTEDERYFETIANVVALAIENARLHERVERQLKAIAAKASHRIGNLVTNYDGIELDLGDESRRVIPDNQKIAAIRTRVITTTRNLKRMIEEFKHYGKPLRLEKQLSSINTIIESEAWLARPPRQIKVDTSHLDPSLPAALIDAGRFGEAFKELFRNALKAIQSVREHGSIRVSTQVLPPGNIMVTFEDDGPGFPEGLPLFEPFQATNPNSTGLGLATVRELIEAHGGAIRSARPCDLGGACIQFVVPIAGESTP